jgi:hypothetical protein
MQKFLGIKSNLFNNQLTADYIAFVLKHNDWFKGYLDKAGIDIRQVEADDTWDEEDLFSEVYLGGELAVWLYEGLLKNGCTKSTGPVMEDYGWCFSVNYQGRQFTIDIWDSPDGGKQYNWLMGIKEFKPVWKFAMKKDPAALEQMVKTIEQLLDNAQGTTYQWFAERPV